MIYSSTMELSTILLTLLVMFVVWMYAGRKSRMINRLPGPVQIPMIGGAIKVAFLSRERVMQLAMEWFRLYGPIFRTWQGPIPAVHICGAEYAEILLSEPKYHHKGIAYMLLHPWLGTGLLTSNNEKWFSHRKLITPTFHFKILETFLDVFNENSRVLVEKIKATKSDGEEFDIYPFITKCALDIICESAMGIKINAQSQDVSSYVTAVYKVSNITAQRHFRFWLIPNIIFYNTNIGREYVKNVKILHNFTESVIRERKELRKLNKKDENEDVNDVALGIKKRSAFLDLLLESNESNKWTEKDIREEVDTFMFEGHDTTTAAICWTVFLLASHPDIQENVHQELSSIFSDCPKRSATMNDLNEMKYLERVIKESLRLYPSVPFIIRHLKEDVRLGKYLVPKDSAAVFHIINLHRDPRHFPEPEKFDPDRFLPDVVQKRHPYAYIPFSAGPRNCIGQKFALIEEKVLLSELIRNFKFETNVKRENLVLSIALVLRPQSGIKIKAIRRKN